MMLCSGTETPGPPLNKDNAMFTRRKFLIGGAASFASGLGFMMPAAASDSLLLADILHGVSDALVSDYIRDHYREGRWDGSHWWYGGHKYTPQEYSIFLEKRYAKVHPEHKMIARGGEPAHWQPGHEARDGWKPGEGGRGWQGSGAGKAPAHNPGRAPEANTGHAPGANPGHAPGGSPGRAPGANAGRAPEANPGHAPGANSGRAPGGSPGRAPGANAGRAPEAGRGQGPGGSAAAKGPAGGNPGMNRGGMPSGSRGPSGPQGGAAGSNRHGGPQAGDGSGRGPSGSFSQQSGRRPEGGR